MPEYALINAPARFQSKVVVVESGCWEWQGSRLDGYGRYAFWMTETQKTRLVQAHRFAYEHFVGLIPADLTIDHLCRNRCCVNPAHLEPVTRGENVRRGAPYRSRVNPTQLDPMVHARKTHCKRGHEFTLENTVITKGGRGRQCRTCRRMLQKKWRAENLDFARLLNRRQKQKERRQEKLLIEEEG